MKSKQTELITTEEVALILRVPESRIRYFVFKRQIPHLKIGRSVRFDSSEIKKWLVDRKRGEI